jgi:hypothetical protein
VHLVRKQAGLEHVGKRVVAAPKLPQKLAPQLQSFRYLVFAIDVVQDIAVHDGLIIGAAQFVHEFFKIAQPLRFQQPALIEVLPGQRLYRWRRRGRKPQTYTQNFAIVQRQSCPCPTERSPLECFAVPPPEPEQ